MTKYRKARLTYRRIASMSGQELLDGLKTPQVSGVRILIRTEVELRLVNGLRRVRRTSLQGEPR